MDSGIKPHPTCRWFHTAIRLLDDIMKAQGLRLDEIEKILICTSLLTVRLPSYVAVNNWAEAEGKELWLSQFSVNYALACKIYGVVPGPEWAKP